MQPSIPLDFFAKRAQCWLVFSSLSTIPPRPSLQNRDGSPAETLRRGLAGGGVGEGGSASIAGEVIAGCKEESLRVPKHYRRM